MTRTPIALAVCLTAIALLTGCGESPDMSTPPATNAPTGATNAGINVDKVSQTMAAVSDTIREKAQNASDATARSTEAAAAHLKDAGATVEKVVSDTTAAAREKFDALTAEVDHLIDSGKGSEAVHRLQAAAADLKLTPEQKQKVDDLFARAKDAMKKGVETASQAVGDLLKKQN